MSLKRSCPLMDWAYMLLPPYLFHYAHLLKNTETVTDRKGNGTEMGWDQNGHGTK